MSNATSCKPKCFTPEKNNPYPLCIGAKNNQDFALNDCTTCSLYCDYDMFEEVYTECPKRKYVKIALKG